MNIEKGRIAVKELNIIPKELIRVYSDPRKEEEEIFLKKEEEILLKKEEDCTNEQEFI